MVPKGWHRTTVGDLCDLINGNGFKPSDWAEEGLPIIRIQNLNGSADFNHFAGTPNPRWIVSPGDILFAWAGSKGISFGAKRWLGPKGVLNQHIFRVEAKTAVDAGWLYEALRTVTERVESQAHGFKATLLHVQKADIKEQQLLVPPLSEQKRIARILSSWDRAISITEKLFTNSQQLKKALLQRLLSGRLRLSGLNTAWKQVPLASCLEGSSLRNAGMSMNVESIRSVNKTEGMIPMREQTIGKSIDRYKLVKPGWFAYNPMRINVGSICRWHSAEDCLVSPDYVVFHCKEQLLGEYLDQFRQSRRWTEFMESAGNGSVRVRIYLEDLNRLEIPLPPLDEQKKIVAVLEDADREIEILKKQLDGLKKEKKALMQQLLTGKRRVKVDEPEVA